MGRKSRGVRRTKRRRTSHHRTRHKNRRRNRRRTMKGGTTPASIYEEELRLRLDGLTAEDTVLACQENNVVPPEGVTLEQWDVDQAKAALLDRLGERARRGTYNEQWGVDGGWDQPEGDDADVMGKAEDQKRERAARGHAVGVIPREILELRTKRKDRKHEKKKGKKHKKGKKGKNHKKGKNWQ